MKVFKHKIITIALLATVITSVCITPLAVHAQEQDEQQTQQQQITSSESEQETFSIYNTVVNYNAEDVVAINQIIDSIGLTATKDDPANWNFVTWKEVEGEQRAVYFNVSRNQGLNGTLDLRALTKLEGVACDDTEISGLIVTGLTEMGSIACSNTNITKLDLSNLLNLNSIYIQDTPIEELNVRGSTNMLDLVCIRSNLTQLDVSDMPRLYYLKCSENEKLTQVNLNGATNLRNLDFYKTNITTLDLSQSLELNSFFFTQTPIQNLKLPNGKSLIVNTNGGSTLLTAFHYNTIDEDTTGTFTMQPHSKQKKFLGWRLPDGTLLETDTFDFNLSDNVTVEMVWEQDSFVEEDIKQPLEQPTVESEIVPIDTQTDNNVVSPKTGDNTTMVSTILAYIASTAIVAIIITFRKKLFRTK